MSGNICYVKNALKLTTKLMGKRKRMVLFIRIEIMFLFIRIEIYYSILPNKSQTEIAISMYNTQKIQNGFSNFEV